MSRYRVVHSTGHMMKLELEEDIGMEMVPPRVKMCWTRAHTDYPKGQAKALLAAYVGATGDRGVRLEPTKWRDTK